MTRFLGIDMGGTFAKLVVVEVEGERRQVLASARAPTGAADEPAQVIARIAATGVQLLEEHGCVAGVGVGVPGLFDEASGRIALFTNLPSSWTGHDLRRPLAAALGAPAYLINDARAFTLAETRMGAAAGGSTVLCLTLGTGLGGGVVIDGRLRFGPHGRAGEIGHQVIELNGPSCGCGNRGCVEAFVTSAALCRTGGQDSPEAVFAAAAGGDRQATEAIASMISRLALGIGNLITVLWPDLVVVGGGVAGAGEQLLVPLRVAVIAATPIVDPSSYRIVPAILGNSAGAIGAALWASERRITG